MSVAAKPFQKSLSFRPRAKGSAQALGELQSRIMEYLWSNGPTTLAQAARDLEELLSVAYTTVATELTRLQKKGLVKKTGARRETRYAPALSREQFVDRIVGDVVAGLLSAHGEAAIHGFVDAISGDDEAVATTLDLLRRRRRDS